MIRFLHHKEIDKVAWDRCVQQSEEGQIFNFSWYLDVCDKNWCGLVEDDYSAVFPLSFRTKFGIRYIYQPFFTRHGGVIAKEKSTASQRLAFLGAIPHGFRYMDFCLHQGHREDYHGAELIHRKYQELDLSDTYDLIQAGYSENHKRSLRKAEKSNLSIQPDYNPDTVVEQFRLLKKENITAFDEGDYTVLRQLMKSVAAHTPTRCHAVAMPEGLVMAAGYFMQYENRIIYLKGFSSPEGRSAGAMHFLFDRIIRSLAGTEMRLDFGGSDVENVARFYKGFGATDSLYLRLRQNRLPQLIRWMKK
jgi:hypothetical protein